MELEKLKYPIGKFISQKTFSTYEINDRISVLEHFPKAINDLTYTLSIAELNYKYRPDGWSIKQIVHHCADSHINAFVRTKLALTEILPAIKPYNEASWANLADGNCDVILDSLLIIKGIHARWTTLLKSLSTADFEKDYYHPENNKNYKLSEVVALYAWHCKHHLAHIKNALTTKSEFEK
jgi:DinB superfamily